jgi:hypothetical protein
MDAYGAKSFQLDIWQLRYAPNDHIGEIWIEPPKDVTDARDSRSAESKL